jgi:hypothetical protein
MGDVSFAIFIASCLFTIFTLFLFVASIVKQESIFASSISFFGCLAFTVYMYFGAGIFDLIKIYLGW